MLSKSLITRAQETTFVASSWEPVAGTESIATLKELWDVTMPGTFKKIEGTPTIKRVDLEDGNSTLNIAIKVAGLDVPVEIPLSKQSDLDEGDTIEADSICVREFKKVGRKNTILRYGLREDLLTDEEKDNTEE